MATVSEVLGRFEIPTAIIVNGGFADLFTVIVNCDCCASFTGAAHFRLRIVGVSIIMNFTGGFTHFVHDVFNRRRFWRNRINNDDNRV